MCLTSVMNQTHSPTEVIVRVDGGMYELDTRLMNCFSHKNIKCKVLFGQTSGISSVRHELLKEAENEIAIFVDDDMLLDMNACNNLISRYTPPMVGFVEGRRVEVGGRENSSLDVKKVKSISDVGHIEYGDTALLLINVKGALKINWERLHSILGKRGLGGEDIVMTLMMRKKGFVGIGCPEAFGYHLAKPNVSYWDKFIPLDSLIQQEFKEDIGEELLNEVYGK